MALSNVVEQLPVHREPCHLEISWMRTMGQWQLRIYPDRMERSVVSADCILCDIPLITIITVIAADSMSFVVHSGPSNCSAPFPFSDHLFGLYIVTRYAILRCCPLSIYSLWHRNWSKRWEELWSISAALYFGIYRFPQWHHLHHRTSFIMTRVGMNSVVITHILFWSRNFQKITM